MKVKMIACTNIDPMDLISHAAKTCYTSKQPELGTRLDVKKALFETGHHTTLEHFYMTYAIEGIAVGDVTFGLHLTHPFYITDQRSGRYAGKMFVDPDYNSMESYIEEYWPYIGDRTTRSVLNYIKDGVDIYQKNMPKAQEIVAGFINDERPYAGEGIKKNIPKFAQEQMRMFIPIIFPTALDYTVNIIGLVSMYESAWTPAMRHVTNRMAQLFVEKFPDMNFLFDESRRRKNDWVIIYDDIGETEIKYKPDLHSLSITSDCEYLSVGAENMHPVDKLHFTPEYMTDSIDSMKMIIAISVATMGQDQRHRTISRGEPSFTGEFYLPPVATKLGLEKNAIQHMNMWKEISKSVPNTLAMILAPYGAIVSYDKRGSFNAIAHEQCKRLCWCAQEEIYHLGRLQRIAIQEKLGIQSSLLEIFQPPCFENGKCGEGDRYCGRDISLRKTGDYFPERRV